MCMCAQVPIYAIHRDPEIYADPEEYKPERWVEGTREYAADKHVPGKWMPFGEGTRVCVGQRLALIEAKIALAHVFRKYAPSLPCIATKKIIKKESSRRHEPLCQHCRAVRKCAPFLLASS